MPVNIVEMQKRAVDFCSRLIAIPSPAGQEADAIRLVADEMRSLGYHKVEIDEAGNVVGSIYGKSSTGYPVLFDGHIDTVGVTDRDQWTKEPFGGEVKGGRIWGRGASDMKGSIAAMVYAGAVIAAQGLAAGAVHVSASVSEEVFEGAALVTEIEKYKPACVVIGEATGLGLALGQRGRMEIIIEVRGKAAHSSTPELGVSAVEKMVDILTALRGLPTAQDPLLGSGVLVLTDIVSEPFPATSVVPHRCVATFDRRFVVSEDEASVLEPIRNVIDVLRRTDPTFEATVKIAEGDYMTYTGLRLHGPKILDSWKTKPDGREAMAARDALKKAGLPLLETKYAFCTNGSASARLGVPTIGFGAGFEGQAHTKDEFVDVEQVEKAFLGYIELGHALSSDDRQMLLC